MSELYTPEYVSGLLREKLADKDDKIATLTRELEEARGLSDRLHFALDRMSGMYINKESPQAIIDLVGRAIVAYRANQAKVKGGV